MHLREVPLTGTPVMKVKIRIYQQLDVVRIEPGTAGWEAGTLPLSNNYAEDIFDWIGLVLSAKPTE